MKLTRARRYQLGFVVFFIIWGGAYLLVQYLEREPDPDSVEALVESAQEQITSLDASIVGDISNLSGRIVFLEQRGQPHYRVAQLDFATGDITTSFSIPPQSLVYQIGKLPDVDSVLMTYTPPPEDGQTPYDRNGIFELDLTTGDITLIVGNDAPDVYYAYQQANADAIYYVTYTRTNQTRNIERFDRDTGAITRIAESATLPILSADGNLLTYLKLNTDDGARSLWLADGQTGDPIRELIPENTYPDIDLPVFSPDGETLYFVVLEPQDEASLTPFDVLMGAQKIYAHGSHDVPATWYQIPISGGEATPITTESAITIYADQHNDTLGFVNTTGFYVVEDDIIRPIIESRTMRSFVWLPE